MSNTVPRKSPGGGVSDTQSETDDDVVATDDQEHVIDPISNGGRILRIWIHLRL